MQTHDKFIEIDDNGIIKIDKTKLFNKINHFTKKDGFTDNEITFLKNKILNDKLGLVLNFEQTDEKLDKNYVGLSENKKYDINPLEKNNHLIIEGDNYHILSFFKLIHFKVDVIYIDPPYNTGNNDFKYNDVFISKDDTYKHSKWLSFMEKRLKIAKDLLNNNGVIFISIDDNEQAYLKVLCDEIFGDVNFVGNIIWAKKTINMVQEIFKKIMNISWFIAKMI